jgi:hypothetical protein
MQIPCVYLPGPAPAVTVANTTNVRQRQFSSIPYFSLLKSQHLQYWLNFKAGSLKRYYSYKHKQSLAHWLILALFEN